LARKEDMLVEINAGLGMGVWNGKSNSLKHVEKRDNGLQVAYTPHSAIRVSV
jgi:hypothetical protein